MSKGITEKVKINDQEFEIRLLPITPQTDNTTTTLNPATATPPTTEEVVRELPSVTRLPRWEDGAPA